MHYGGILVAALAHCVRLAPAKLDGAYECAERDPDISNFAPTCEAIAVGKAKSPGTSPAKYSNP